MGLAGMLPGEGVWDIRVRKVSKDPGRYSLNVRDSGSAVFAGPFNLRFPTPEYAVSWLSVLTELEEEDARAVATLAEGKYLETTGHSSHWLYVIMALFHSGGPIGGYPVSTWWTDAASGPDPIFVAYDPLQESPDGYTTVDRPAEIEERAYLTTPENPGQEVPINSFTVYWDSKTARLPVPIIEIELAEGDPLTLRLTRGPFLKEDWQGMMFFTEEGEWRLRRVPKDELPPDTTKTGARDSGVREKDSRDKSAQKKGSTPTQYGEVYIDPESGRLMDLVFVVTNHGSYMRRDRMWVPFAFDGSYEPDGLEIVALSKKGVRSILSSWDNKIALYRSGIDAFVIDHPDLEEPQDQDPPGRAK
jgi:hypothetical protein